MVPFQLPAEFHKNKLLRKGWPVPRAEFEQLATKIEERLVGMGAKPTKLEPGDTFQPGYLDVPSKPRADFLWSQIGSPVVSQRVKDLLVSMDVQEIEFWPVELRKIGKREAKLPAPIPSSGEPEDILESVPLLKKTDHLGPYYNMVVLGHSDRPPGGKPLSVCPDCGWERLPPSILIRYVMRKSMWKGHDVFFLGKTGHLMVTDRVKIALQKMMATNVEYRSRAKELRITPMAAAIRAAKCCYCGRKPCVGADLSFKRFMCDSCSGEYYRVTQLTINQLPSDLTQAELARRSKAIVDAAEVHMKKWASKAK